MTNTVIGRVVATEKHPTTIDDFTFWTDPELILNPFDIVKVQHVNNSFSYGVIEDIAHITDAASFLTNFISSDFGDVTAEENTLRVGMNYVTAKVVCNTENIYIPLQSNAKVMLATAEEINYALGLNDIRNPLVCGYIEMYEGTKGCEKVTLPVNLNSKFIIGPEGAHLNISGISGLASKTSYAMFLLKAIQDSYMRKDPKSEDEDSVAFVLFNVKGKDLLAIDQLDINISVIASLARFCILFILPTHSIRFSALSCSVTPSLSAYSFTSRRKSDCASSSTSARCD